ncbi:poly [ADP-ribose] polymerase [Thrips palmi]|uniref:Poly [ADP-ribose] polymerase n=1 Tax=Thrips palmi TaxID=161013 RepID=A0A6P8ZTJ9_THRPL|nr:poly [ADP-ribose] polymerase [Thrips palmi]
MDEDLPYRAEYAKSARASCKTCKGPIAKDVLRLAVLVQSSRFDGKMTLWHHFECFFTKQRPKTVGDIAHFDSLRYDDQEKIKAKIDNCGPAPAANGKGKGKKRAAVAAGVQDFSVEYAKSNRAECRGCEQKIMKDVVRISKKDFQSESGKKFGGENLWHHVECFAKLRDELQFWASGADLPGFFTLTKEDQQTLKEQLPKVTPKVVKDEVDGVTPAKKIKSEKLDNEEEEEIKRQNIILYGYRDKLKEQLKKKELEALFVYNKQAIPSGQEQMLDRLGDIMTFGKLLPCPVCKDGQFVFRSGVGYQCLGNISEWAKCENRTLDPPRGTFRVPKDLKESYPFLESYKYKPEKRIIKIVPSSTASSSVTSHQVKSEPGSVTKSIPKVNRPPPPFDNLEFVILGKLKMDKDELKNLITKNGGKVGSKIHSKTFAVISTAAEVERLNSRMEQAQDEDVHVVSEDFVKAVLDGESALKAVDKMSIAPWGGDPTKRIPEKKESLKSKSASMYKSKSGTVKLKLKDGSAVDPDSGLEDRAHVYKDGKTIYNAALSITDIQKDKNSFYKLQILEADKSKRYWLFRSWGRIGTTIGGTKLEDMSLEDAIDTFEDLYHEKSGNSWSNRNHFVKVPGRMYPMEVDYGNEEKALKLADAQSNVKSKLAKSVQDLIKTIFDVETMKKCMMEFELDLEKMPLGKLSQKQLLQAYSVLKDALELVQKEDKEGVTGPNSRAKYIDLTNRFFTLVPHDFGVDKPPLLNTEELIKQKMNIIDNLLEIEIAYNLLEGGASSDNVHPIDAQYEKLKADIEVLDKNAEEYKLLETYVKNTHASTHTQYSLEIDEVFKVRRHGEERKYKPFEKLHNKKLLWHGSRLTNYAGILSQGLRIAPPEAPVTGYMFGKGVYFADMVSKSANYCCTSKSNPIGYMLLCEVALGNMYERTRADFIEKLPKGKHSCKGVGKSEPDPAESVKTKDGVEIPLGKGVTDLEKDSTLLYNEYIVYDTAQVKFQYLFKMKFKYL